MNNHFALGLAVLLGLGIIVSFFGVNPKKEITLIDPPTEKQSTETQPEESKPEVSVAPKTYSEALELAKKQDKKLFLFFAADYCGYCTKMKKQTLSDASVKQALSKYIVYYVDIGVERGVSQKYKVRGVPAYFVIDSNEVVYRSGAGFKSPSTFKTWLFGLSRL